MAAGEECDDLESWEEMEDSGILDKKLEKLKAAMSTSIQKDFGSDIASSDKTNTVVFLAEDGRTRYVPPEPTVKILKRPSIVNSTHNAGGDGFIINGDGSTMKPKQPIKTLQQREIEYAEARLRILGEAQSPDERPALLDRIRRIQNKSESGADNVTEQNCIASIAPVSYSSPAVFSPLAMNQVTSMAPPSAMSSPPPQQPTIIMTSTASPLIHTQMIKGCGGMPGNNGNGMGQYGIMYASANNGCGKNMHVNAYGNAPVGYTSGGIYCHNIIPNHQQNSYAVYNNMCNSMSPPPQSAAITGYLNASVGTATGVGGGNNNYVALQAPISLNLAIRQPRGPDGTKGFNNFRNTLR